MMYALRPTDSHLRNIRAIIQDVRDVDEQQSPPMLNCEKWIALKNAAMSAVRFQDMPHMYESLSADRQRLVEEAVRYLHAGLRRVDPEEDITQDLLSKSERLKASEEFLRTGRPRPPHT